MPKTLYIIDGHSQIFRAYYAPGPRLTSPTGEPTGAVHVFGTMLLKFIQDKKPDYLAMAIDGPAAELERRAFYPDYKVTRKPVPDDFHPQAQRIIALVEAMGIPILQAKGHEADDILATAVDKFASEDIDVVLVSRDKDLDQLVGEHVTLYEPMKDKTIDAATIEKEKGYPPEKAVEVQTLSGDASDNIPGVPGVGPKTAAKLIVKYGSADEVLKHADEQTPKLKEHLLAAGDTLGISRQLVTLKRDVPIDLDLDAMAYSGIAPEARTLMLELGLTRLLGRLDDLGVGGDEKLDVEQAAADGGQTAAGDFDYTCVDTPEALDALAIQLDGVKRLAVDTETTALLPLRAELVGMSLAWKSGAGVYIPVKGPLGATTLDVDRVREKIGPILADVTVEKIGQNIKYDMLVLQGAGFELAGDIFDTMVAAWVLDSSRDTYKMDALATEFLNHRCIPIEEVIGRGRNQTTMDTVPIDTVAPYAAEDADITLRLADVLGATLAEEGLDALFRKLEMPLLPVLFEMERTGVRVDPKVLKKMEVTLSKEADSLRDRIIEAAGSPFNPDSPKQLAEILFNKLQFRVIKKGKTGPSTDSGVLEQLAAESPDNPLCDLVLEYRKLTKLLSTYLTALAACILPSTGRVHTNFSQTGTATGRLSSRDPNLQNIPIRTELGRQIRAAFVADEGNVLLSADYSQVELRVLAHLCQDPTLIQAFADDQDIHRIVAAEVFDVAPDDVTPEQRSRAKTVNFGIIYGQTAFGLAVTLRISRTEAGEFIKRYRKRFPKIDQFLAACIKQAKSAGYVETIFNRRRSIPDIASRNPQARSAAERLAINSVVQGSAADLIKQAMVKIHANLANSPARMLLQIHDELLFEIPQADVESQQKMIVKEMESAIQLRVPVKVDVGIGTNWMDAK